MSEEEAVEGLMAADQAEDEVKSQNEEDGVEEEYEIEAILKVRRNMFGTRMGYFVKWKGYPPSENSWVDEMDAGGADELIREYWATNSSKSSKAAKSRSNGSPNGKGTASRGRPRKSDVAPTSRAATSKRALTGDNTSDSEAEPADNGRVKRLRESSNDIGDDSLPTASSMKEFASKKNWEKSVKEIETVQRDQEGALTVYFTLSNGQRVKESASLCRVKMPQKMFNFYECAIAWRTEEGELVDRHAHIADE